LPTVSALSYLTFTLVTTALACLSCAFLIVQAIRSSPSRTIKNNGNVVIIGAAYVLVLFATMGYCVRRRVEIRRKLQKISKVYKPLGKGDVPDRVHQYLTQEYARACLVTYASSPKDGYHEGWGLPGTRYEGIQFRRSLLDTIPVIDELAHQVIPRHPELRPHARVLHHFRFILPLLSKDEDGLTPLHYYDSGIQLVRNSSVDPTEAEYARCMAAAHEIKRVLDDCSSEMAIEQRSSAEHN